MWVVGRTSRPGSGRVQIGLLILSLAVLLLAAACSSGESRGLTEYEVIVEEAVAAWLHAIYLHDLDALWDASASESVYRDGVFLMNDPSFEFLVEPDASMVRVTVLGDWWCATNVEGGWM